MGKAKRWAKEIMVGAVLLMAVLFGMDFLRAPQAPVDFGNQTLQTLDGQTLTLNEKSQQQPLLVYFWASWCSVCKFTTPDVGKLSANGGNVLSVALRSGDKDKIERYLQGKNISMPVVNDPRGDISASWDIGVTPTFVIIDKGRVVSTTTGWTSYWGMKLRLWLAQL
jgi:thiol-disulfide isomerase/thioredoxin